MTIKDLKDITSFKWGTITALTPLAVKLDGDTTALSLVPDCLIDPQTLVVGDRVRVELSLRKAIIHGKSGGDIPSGEVRLTASSVLRAGWLLCQGQSLLRSSYPTLFAAIGTTYGAADSTHFSLPNMKGKVAVGQDSSQSEFDTMGKTGGEKSHTITISEMPVHHHNFKYAGVEYASWNYMTAGGSSINFYLGNNAGSPVSISDVGGNTPHNNLQPYVTLNYIIKI